MMRPAITVQDFGLESVVEARSRVLLRLDIGPLEWINTASLSGFNGRLLSRFPGLSEHGCTLGVSGGFVRRLIDGVYLAHVVEHVALELQRPLGVDHSDGETRRIEGRSGLYDVCFGCCDDESGRRVARAALEAVEAMLPIEYRGVDGLERITGLSSTGADAVLAS